MESGYSFTGYQVYDMHYEKIGKVDDIFVDENDNPEYIGVKMGFLGTRTTLIPIELARFNDKRRLVEIAADKDTIKEGPTFGDDREITSEFEQRVLSYYRLETAQIPMERGAYGAYYPAATGGERLDLQPGEHVEARERSGEVHPRVATRDGADRERGGDLGDNELRVQRAEEELRAGVREREAGGVNVRKRVRTDHERLAVPKRREEVHVDRVPVEGRESSEPKIKDGEVRVPVIEEELVVEKRPVVKEEIRLRKEVVEEGEVVEEDVRKEEVDIDDRTERRRSLGHGSDMRNETVHYLPKEAWTSPQERRETDREKREAPKKGQQHVAKNAKADKKAQKQKPIKNYDDLTVEEAKKKLDGLSEGELKKIRTYEKKHKNRKTLVEHLDRKIKNAS
jgi:uncharacterized protein (TIGR02271 family)